MWECLLAVRHCGCPVSDTSAELRSLRMQHVSKAKIPNSFGKRLIYVNGDTDDVSEFATVFDEHDRVLDLQLVSKNAESEAYFAAEIEYDPDNPSILSLINQRGMFHHGSIGIQEGIEHWLLYSKEKTEIKQLSDEIESHNNSVTIDRIVDLSGVGHISNIEQGMLFSQLTDQQLKTFQTALLMGYYEEDSDTIVKDIAEELNRHDSTTWEHLNKAENVILTNIGNQLFSTREAETLLRT